MKYCIKCGTQLADEDAFCIKCGHPTEIPAQAPNFAPNCAPNYTPNYAPNYAPVYAQPVFQNPYLTKLSERLKVNGIIWIVVAVIQIIIGLLGTWVPLLVGVLNIVSAIKDLNYSNTVLVNPRGIVSNFEPLTSPIITLVYNLVVGGMIGVAGSIYYFIALRGYVMENKNAFLALENSPAVNVM